MPNSLCKRTAIAAAVAACFPGLTFAAGVARVDFAVGNVSAVGSDGRSRTLAKGSEIEVGETIATQQGRAQLRFADGAYMSLQPGTEFKVEQFKFSGRDDPQDSVVMNLIKGGMRTITGLIGKSNRQGYKMRTEVATIGIRGTEYTVRYTNSIEVFCVDGAISVINDAGTLNLGGGQGAHVTSVQTPPARTDTPPSLPPQPGPGNQQQGDKPADPTNPQQEANKCEGSQDPACASVPAGVPFTQILTGTFEGHAGFSSYDSGTNVTIPSTITLDSSGRLTSFFDSFEGTLTPGTATVVSAGNDGVIAWGRWVGGVAQSSVNGPITLTEPMHYIVGLPATNMPTTGAAVYNMIGYSASCSGSGCTGLTVNSSSLNVNFSAMTVELAKSFTLVGGINAGTWTTILEASGLQSNGRFSTSNSVTGPGTGGFIGGQGFLAGDGATRAGLAWSGYVYTYDGQTQTYNYTYPNGVTAYKK